MAVLNNPEVAALLREKFVCIAVDNVDHPNMCTAERDFLLDKGLKACTQGMSVFTADGKLLATGGGFDAPPVKKMLEDALGKLKPEDVKFDAADANFKEALLTAVAFTAPTKNKWVVRRPPDGGLVLFITWKVLGGYDKPQSSSTTGDGLYDKEFRNALGVDRLWVRADETDALTNGEFYESLKRRMLRTLSYVFAGDVKTLDVTLHDGKLTGTFQSDTGDAGTLQGFVEARNGKIRRFDVIAKGVAEHVSDCGFSASLLVVPKGVKVPAAVAFTLADTNDDLAKVVPYRANDENYLR